MSQHSFQLFIDLVTFDQETRKLIHSIEVQKKQIEELRSRVRKLNQEHEEKKQLVIDLRKKVDNAELEMKTLDTQEIQKKQKIEGVSDHKEYIAIKAEIERVQRAQVEQEQVVIAAWNKLEHAQQEVQASQKTFDESYEQLQKEIQQLQSDVELKQKNIDERNKERQKKIITVPEEWIDKYEMMQSRVSDPVVPVESNSCTACFSMLTNADLQRVQKGALLQCKICYRLLYLSEFMNGGK